MGAMPQAVASQPQGSPQQGSPAVKLAMLAQLIRGLAQEFPQGQAGIQQMMQGLQQVQASASASSSQQQPAAPPR